MNKVCQDCPYALYEIIVGWSNECLAVICDRNDCINYQGTQTSNIKNSDKTNQSTAVSKNDFSAIEKSEEKMNCNLCLFSRIGLCDIPPSNPKKQNKQSRNKYSGFRIRKTFVQNVLGLIFVSLCYLLPTSIMMNHFFYFPSELPFRLKWIASLIYTGVFELSMGSIVISIGNIFRDKIKHDKTMMRDNYSSWEYYAAGIFNLIFEDVNDEKCKKEKC